MHTYLCSPLKRLVIKPYAIDYKEIVKMAQLSSESMYELEIDVE